VGNVVARVSYTVSNLLFGPFRGIYNSSLPWWYMLQARGASSPSLERVRHITNNIKAFSAMDRGRTGDRNCNAQRDQSVQLEPFENAAFALS
jgi:hypothetical protein